MALPFTKAGISLPDWDRFHANTLLAAGRGGRASANAATNTCDACSCTRSAALSGASRSKPHCAWMMTHWPLRGKVKRTAFPTSFGNPQTAPTPTIAILLSRTVKPTFQDCETDQRVSERSQSASVITLRPANCSQGKTGHFGQVQCDGGPYISHGSLLHAIESAIALPRSD